MPDWPSSRCRFSAADLGTRPIVSSLERSVGCGKTQNEWEGNGEKRILNHRKSKIENRTAGECGMRERKQNRSIKSESRSHRMHAKQRRLIGGHIPSRSVERRVEALFFRNLKRSLSQTHSSFTYFSRFRHRNSIPYDLRSSIHARSRAYVVLCLCSHTYHERWLPKHFYRRSIVRFVAL